MKSSISETCTFKHGYRFLYRTVTQKGSYHPPASTIPNCTVLHLLSRRRAGGTHHKVKQSGVLGQLFHGFGLWQRGDLE